MTKLILATALTTITSGLVSAIIASLITISKAKVKEEQKTLKALNKGVRALLWERLNNIYEYALWQDGLTVDERHNAENIYNAYHALGGNGTGTKLYEAIENLPIRQEQNYD